MLAAARDACGPEGVFVLTAHPRDAGDEGIAAAVRSLATGVGHAPTGTELRTAVEAAGFGDVASRPVPRTARIAVVGRSPE